MAENNRSYDTIVIGGGQAGLATGYYLKQQGGNFVILDANGRTGDSWRSRWDSLRLFTPARYDGLPGMPFPAPAHTFPTKDEMADYLETYAAEFRLPVKTGVRVDRLSREGDHFLVSADDQQFEADNVVVATGAYHGARIPDFASELDSRIKQLHSSEYCNPSQLLEGGVLVVGASNSGAEIALEVAHDHHTILSGRDTGSLPFRIENRLLGSVFLHLLDFAGNHVLTVNTPIGRKALPHFRAHGTPVVRVKPADLEAAGVERVFARTTGVRDGKPALEDGRTLEVANVVWCTGFRKEFGWIDLAIFGEDGYPEQYRGVVQEVPGLYFMGLVFQYSESSSVLPGVGRDAKYIAEQIAARSSVAAAGEAGSRSVVEVTP